MTFVQSLASMLVLFILPSAAPPMPAERKIVERTSRRFSIISVESTTSTLVGDAPEPVLEEKEIRKARRGSFSESVLQNKIVLHRPKALVHLSSTMQTSVVIPASKLPSQIITPTKASVRCTLIKVARFSCKGYKASKKLVRKL